MLRVPECISEDSCVLLQSVASLHNLRNALAKEWQQQQTVSGTRVHAKLHQIPMVETAKKSLDKALYQKGVR